eukprot:UN25750
MGMDVPLEDEDEEFDVVLNKLLNLINENQNRYMLKPECIEPLFGKDIKPYIKLFPELPHWHETTNEETENDSAFSYSSIDIYHKNSRGQESSQIRYGNQPTYTNVFSPAAPVYKDNDTVSTNPPISPIKPLNSEEPGAGVFNKNMNVFLLIRQNYYLK